ncbi:MAG TPA: hypothetical protein VK846_13870 [Candidatus Limnocylindria bacterium]|nr:hypothetical protein [Candidatus Limnocylindria bacterium]
MISRRTTWVWLLYLAFNAPLASQSIVTFVSPTNQSRFSKALGMELSIRLDASVSNPGPGTTYVNFFDDLVFIGSGSSQNGWSMIWSNVGFGPHTLMAGVGGMPSSNPVNIFVNAEGVAFVNEEAVWKYLDGGLDPDPTWFAPGADLRTWPSGRAQFGFGEQDELTVVNFFNMSDGSIHPAYYFRHAFHVTNAAAHSNLVVRLLRDDGAIVYLNGQELFRGNMPSGAVSNKTYALTGAVPENEFIDHWVNPAALLEGTNHLAVEIHNQGAHSEDISFDLRLIADLPIPPPRVTVRRTGSSLVLSWPKLYLGYRLQAAQQLGIGDWQTVTNVFSGSSDFRSTNSFTSTAKFFRLTL